MKLKEFLENWAPLAIGALIVYGIIKFLGMIREVMVP